MMPVSANSAVAVVHMSLGAVNPYLAPDPLLSHRPSLGCKRTCLQLMATQWSWLLSMMRALPIAWSWLYALAR